MPKSHAAATVILAIYYSLVSIAGYGSTAFLGVFWFASALSPHNVGDRLGFFGLVPILAPLVLLFFVIRAVRRKTSAFDVLKAGYAILVLLMMPAWGIAINHAMLETSCVVDPCSISADHQFRALAEPGVFVLAGLQCVVALAFFISRRRPEKLHPLAEPWVHASLLVGVWMHMALAIHFGKDIVVGASMFPFGGCAIAPVLAVPLLLTELRSRLRRRGQEAAQPSPTHVSDPFRGGAVLESSPVAARLHWRTLFAAAARAPAILGIYAVICAIAYHEKYGAFAVFAQTCGHTFSAIPVRVLAEHPCGDHYLCTVAARGHAWLARPERIGVRRGAPIVVNRQLAIANAFEDLLHERTPRFGAFARRAYDALGLPVSRLIRGPWLADFIFVAMKPFEWAFYITLLVFDSRSPEARIDRMYRQIPSVKNSLDH